ncbi:MAG: hypothetical protein HN551_11180 [Tateyamaria sp.]|jgi:hypothetical protein|nr:hypothetical protein [Tateyamaria sp.]
MSVVKVFGSKDFRDEKMVKSAIFFFDLGPYGTLGVLMLMIFFIGPFLEWVRISFPTPRFG